MNFAAEKEIIEMMKMVQEYLQKFKSPVVGKQVIQNVY
jgi:hypothetical protein